MPRAVPHPSIPSTSRSWN